MAGAGIADREIVLTRLFEAPRELVFKAWTDPDLLMKWLCPRDFTVTFVDIDLREGGAWRSGMRSPEGIDYIMRGSYRVVKEPEMLVLTHAWEDDLEPGHLPGHETLITVILSEIGDKTQMTFHVTGLTSDESRDGQQQGWSQAFDNLETALAV
jgi:uncharacterized protein YndB with AHSA1/START domain